MQYGIPSYAVVRVGSRQKGAVAVDLAPLEQEQRLWAVLVREGDDFAVVFELLPTKLRKTITDRMAWPEPQRIVGRYPIRSVSPVVRTRPVPLLPTGRYSISCVICRDAHRLFEAR